MTPSGLIGDVSGTQYINWAARRSLPRSPVSLAGLQMHGPSILSIIVDGYLVHRRRIAPGLASTLIELLERSCDSPSKLFVVLHTESLF